MSIAVTGAAPTARVQQRAHASGGREKRPRATSRRGRARSGGSRPAPSGGSASRGVPSGELVRQKGEALVDFAGRFRVALVVAAVLIVILVALYAPAQGLYVAWREQGVCQAQLAELNEANEGYQQDIDRLQTREGIEDEARRRGYVAEGETELVVEGLPESDAGTDEPAQEVPWYIAVADFIFQYKES